MADLAIEPKGVRPVNAEMRAWVPVVDSLFWHVAQPIPHHNRLHHPGDDTDHEYLVGMNGEHFVPDRLALAGRVGGEPFRV